MTTKKPRSYLKISASGLGKSQNRVFNNGTTYLVHMHNGVLFLLLQPYQNPSGFCFLLQIRAIAILTSLGLTNLNLKERKINSDLTCSSKKTSS